MSGNRSGPWSADACFTPSSDVMAVAPEWPSGFLAFLLLFGYRHHYISFQSCALRERATLLLKTPACGRQPESEIPDNYLNQRLPTAIRIAPCGP